MYADRRENAARRAEVRRLSLAISWRSPLMALPFRSAFLAALPRLTAAEVDAAALALFRYQARHSDMYGRWLAARRCDPATVAHVADIPFLPISFFKTHAVQTGRGWAAREVFRSSATTGVTRSQHLVRDPAHYRRHAARIWAATYGPLTRFRFAALLPNYLDQGESSLVAMVNQFARVARQPGSPFFLGDAAGLLAALEAAAHAGRTPVLIGVSYALLDLVEAHGPLTLPTGTIVLETGGMKGRRREIIREELHAALTAGLGVPRIHSEYGMTELLSQAYAPADGHFRETPWLRPILRDTEDPLDVSFERCSGGLNLIDLANVDSCAFIETQDLARRHPETGTFEVLGRFDAADVRGCNLLVSSV